MSVKKVEIISYSGEKPKLDGTVYWSPESGVICDNENLRQSLAFGIAVPPKGDLIYADCGLDFLKALKFRFTGLTRARDLMDAPMCKGKPVEIRRDESPFQV